MNLKDFDFVNECIKFTNGFSNKPVKALTMDTLINDELVKQYKFAIEMTLKLKASTPEIETLKAKAVSADAFLENLRKSKKMTRL
ncbi:MAG: hypothetical protein RR229_01600 [Oscillospiraceae bacterium]